MKKIYRRTTILINVSLFRCCAVWTLFGHRKTIHTHSNIYNLLLCELLLSTKVLFVLVAQLYTSKSVYQPLFHTFARRLTSVNALSINELRKGPIVESHSLLKSRFDIPKSQGWFSWNHNPLEVHCITRSSDIIYKDIIF